MGKSVADMLYGDLPHTAYISVKAAKETVKNRLYNTSLPSASKCYYAEECEKAIEKIPAAFVVPVRTGIWKKDADGIPCCSECGKAALQRLHMHLRLGTFDAPFVESDFCPECGALLKVPAYAE